MTEVLSGGRTATVLGCAAGAVMFTGTMSAAQTPVPGASLSTSITLVGRSALGSDRLAAYSVTVRPAGGVARGAALTLITQEPVRWGGHPAECRSAGRAPQLRCALGNLGRARSVQVTVRIPGSLRVTRGLRIVVVAGASNVARQSMTEVPLPAPAEPSRSPSRPPATAPPPSAVVAPPPRSPGRVKPRRRPARPKRPQPGMQALPPPLSMAPPMQQPPPMMPAPAPLPAPMPLPPMQAVPPLPMAPPMAPPLPGQPGQPALPSLTPDASPPAVAPPLPSSAAATPPSATDGTQMTMISPAGGDESEGTSWAVVLGIAIVAEVALLWIAACLGLWRRRLIASQVARAGATTSPGETPGRRLPRPLSAATALVRAARSRFRRS